MKNILIALICLAAFSSESFSQPAIISTYTAKPVAPVRLYAFDYLNVPVPTKVVGGKVLAELYNAEGKLVIRELVNGSMITMYTGDLPVGIYQLRIYWRDGSITYTVIKNYTR